MGESLRPITVNGILLRWRFDGTLVVVPADRSDPALYVDWGWRDWLEPDGPGAEPQIVTPRFVRDAVQFALSNGWDSTQNGPSFRITYNGGRFSKMG